jgi:hypothetical protein
MALIYVGLTPLSPLWLFTPSIAVCWPREAAFICSYCRVYLTRCQSRCGYRSDCGMSFRDFHTLHSSRDSNHPSIVLCPATQLMVCRDWLCHWKALAVYEFSILLLYCWTLPPFFQSMRTVFLRRWIAGRLFVPQIQQQWIVSIYLIWNSMLCGVALCVTPLSDLFSPL